MTFSSVIENVEMVIETSLQLERKSLMHCDRDYYIMIISHISFCCQSGGIRCILEQLPYHMSLNKKGVRMYDYLH